MGAMGDHLSASGSTGAATPVSSALTVPSSAASAAPACPQSPCVGP